ncbi:DUF3176 domain-containing protein [Aspergillus luchuensis]|uniref:Similar to Pc16g11550 n=1 Tax=Aspergillus kawachii TaxID=1069201 RepID=A0A146FP52_ASPKA|nr:uncharacterized protein AKAW2_20342S [Aspergillus luchuensis]BCR95402.1 hypothetical protein AKAW2_20342S [Aspergillus luchuensis]BCS07949.1 hypothetical protein ALUC_20319S [Aspergillus luchuensis]GAA91814.1 similar to Pc16g11550 [Aspergillus luchuensis IFO 4308]GAT27610.1 similar to Pc16g11550 [Aspergillus luchuensis]
MAEAPATTTTSIHPPTPPADDAAEANIPLLSIPEPRTLVQERRPAPEKNATNHNPPRKFDWAGSWTMEIASAIFSATCLILLVVFLYYVDGTDYNTWHYRLLPNTVASTIVTVAKATLLLVVSSSLSQLKYDHPNQRTPLYHIQVLDQASRGPWGSLEVLWRWRLQPGLITAGAFLTVFSLAIDPLAQQILSYPLIRIKAPTSNGLTYAQCTHSYSTQAMTGLIADLASYAVDPDMLEAIISGLGGQSTGLEPFCSTGDCEYPDFISLGICSSCSDVTAASTQLCTLAPYSVVNIADHSVIFNHSVAINCIYTSPTNHTIAPQIWPATMSGGETEINVYRQPWTSTVTSSEHATPHISSFLSARYANPKLTYTTQNTTAWEAKPTLTECTLSYCERHYTHNFYNATGHRTLTTTNSQILGNASSIDPHFTVFPSLNRSTATNYTVDDSTIQSLNDMLEGIFNSTLLGSLSDPTNTYALLLYNSNNLTESMAQMATAMTDVMRSRSGSGSSNVDGAAYTSRTVIHVRWGWIAVPVAAVIWGVGVLMGTAARSKGSILWKASVWPLVLGRVRMRAGRELVDMEEPRVDWVVGVMKEVEVIREDGFPVVWAEV